MKLLSGHLESISPEADYSYEMFDRALTQASERHNDADFVALLRTLAPHVILGFLEHYNNSFTGLLHRAETLQRKIDVFRLALEKRANVARLSSASGS